MWSTKGCGQCYFFVESESEEGDEKLSSKGIIVNDIMGSFLFIGTKYSNYRC